MLVKGDPIDIVAVIVYAIAKRACPFLGQALCRFTNLSYGDA